MQNVSNNSGLSTGSRFFIILKKINTFCQSVMLKLQLTISDLVYFYIKAANPSEIGHPSLSRQTPSKN